MDDEEKQLLKERMGFIRAIGKVDGIVIPTKTCRTIAEMWCKKENWERKAFIEALLTVMEASDAKSTS
jgi:hypothetical protein